MSKNQASLEQVPHYDIVISGAGVVGCLAAFALVSSTDYRVLLLEAHASADKKSNKNKPAGFDARVIALAAESLRMLEDLGIEINDIPHANIHTIHVSDKGHIGQVRLHADEQGVDALGKVLNIEALGEYLLARLLAEFSNSDESQKSQFEYKSPCKIDKRSVDANENTLYLSTNSSPNCDDEQTITCKLLLISEGGKSPTAELVGIDKQIEDYHQAAIITNVQTQLAHQNVAYERFTSNGPIAFLPMKAPESSNNDHYMSVVWCMDEAQASHYLAMDETQFLKALGMMFGDKLGTIVACSKRFSYPLKLVQSKEFTAHRAICLGNAAQSLHPIAGQGFNLAIRDVFDLIRVLKEEGELGDFSQIHSYKNMRRKDKDSTIGLTNILVSIFSNQYEAMVLPRNIGLVAMNNILFAKSSFARFAMGKR